MPKKNIVVMGGSTGSFDVFKRVVGGLPVDLDAAIFIVWHMSPDVRGILAEVLNNAGPLPAHEARDGDEIKLGNIYVARADHHLLLDNSHMRVTRGPKENRFRPAVDPLFRSAAYEYGPRVVGIITSGALDDGTSGMWAIKMHGGVTVAQDPNDAEIASMPESAIRQVTIDHIVPSKQIADLIVRLSRSHFRKSQRRVRNPENQFCICESHFRKPKSRSRNPRSGPATQKRTFGTSKTTFASHKLTFSPPKLTKTPYLRAFVVR